MGAAIVVVGVNSGVVEFLGGYVGVCVRAFISLCKIRMSFTNETPCCVLLSLLYCSFVLCMMCVWSVSFYYCWPRTFTCFIFCWFDSH